MARRTSGANPRLESIDPRGEHRQPSDAQMRHLKRADSPTAERLLDKIGQVTEPLRVEIKDGWITNVEGGKQAQQLNDIFEKFDPNARRIASQFALGMNPDCRIIPESKEVSKKLGTLHVAMGDNISLGGTIQSGLHIDYVLLNPTVWLDGKLILENGKLFI